MIKIEGMAQPEKRENSVLFSLRELRQIEENRVQEEEQAVRSAEEQRVRSREDAERRRREEEEAKARAEHNAKVALEQAREGAEREARMRVESAEAAERARQQAVLEQSRMQQEMDLRRAEVAKKRPTWMLVVTGLALIAAVAFVIFAVKSLNESKVSKQAETIAKRNEAESKKLADEAQERVAKLEADMGEMNKRVDSAVDALSTAQTQADRDSANSKLAALRREKAEMEQRIADAKAARAKAERKAGVKISKECLENPLARGCS